MRLLRGGHRAGIGRAIRDRLPDANNRSAYQASGTTERTD